MLAFTKALIQMFLDSNLIIRKKAFFVIQSQAWNLAFFSFSIDVARSISLKDGQNSSRTLSWQRQTRNHSSICILDLTRSRPPLHQVNHHLA